MSEEIKNETPVEETENNEKESQSAQEIQNNTPIELTKLGPNEESFVDVVENFRIGIVKENKKSSRLSTISMVAVMALLLPGFFLIGTIPWLAYTFLGIAVLVLIAFAVLIKRISRPDVKGYIKTASTAINRYVFNDGSYKECKYDPEAKIDFSEICEDGVYKDIERCVSRDVVKGLFEDRSFKVAELGIYKPGQKRVKPTAFVGKYLIYPNSLHFVDRIVILSKGATEIDIPDGVEDLEILEGNEESAFRIYGPKGTKLNDVLPQKFIQAIKNVEVKDHLLTLCVCVWAGRSVVYSSYDDESITLPFYKKIDETCYSQYKNDTFKLLQALKLIDKE